MSFKDYKKNRIEQFQSAQEQIAKNTQTNSFEPDPDDWYPHTDKAGNGISVIRFLPPLESEPSTNFVQWFSHSFKNEDNDKWYIENSLKRNPQDKTPDPVAEYNKLLWNSTKDEDHPNRKQASRQKRIFNVRANVYVVSDSANPENNGKIKKFKFGKVIFDMIRLAMNPPEVDGGDNDPQINPFDLIEGANLKIVIFSEKKGGKTQRNYSKSSWKDRGPLGDDDMMEKVWNELNSDPKWSLLAYVADDKFKSYDDLKEHLDKVMDMDTKTGEPLKKAEKAKDSNSGEPRGESQPKSQKGSTSDPKSSEDEDDDYFQNLLDKD